MSIAPAAILYRGGPGAAQPADSLESSDDRVLAVESNSDERDSPFFAVLLTPVFAASFAATLLAVRMDDTLLESYFYTSTAPPGCLRLLL
jgi:hypothetical protein